MFQQEYYTFGEITNKFEFSLAKLEYHIERGELEASVKFAEIPLDEDKIKNLNIQQNEIFDIRKNKVFITKPLPIFSTDAHILLRNKSAVINSFKHNEQVKVIQDAGYQDILANSDDMVVMAAELVRFSYNTPYNSFISVFNGKFLFKDNFEKVLFKNKEFSFGIIQARIIKQLFYAARTNNPWVNGKILLKNAEAGSDRMVDLFKKQPHWKEIIKPDGNGSYRLNIKQSKLKS